MDTSRIIQGYLECDGTIAKISSWEDVSNFVAKFGKAVNEITESELDELTGKEGKTTVDDCGVKYLTNPLILYNGGIIESYKVREGTVAIADNAFKGTGNNKAMKSVYIPDSVIAIGNKAFYWNIGLSLLRMSNNILKIGDEAFRGCENLIVTILPNGLRYIGKAAFEYCGMEEITIPESVQRIGAHAFSECDNLKEIIFKGIPETISSGIFDKCKRLEKIIVPQGFKDYFVRALFPVNFNIIVESQE